MIWAFECLTLLTVNALVGWTTYADSLNTGAMVGAGGVDALTFFHVALCPLPPCQAHTPSFLIHPVPTAQHRAWICRTERTQINAAHSGGCACKHSLLQYMSCETAVTYCERGHALLSQLGHRFSKSSSCLLILSHTHSHMHIQSHARTIGLIPYSVSIFSSTTWAWLPRQPRNQRKSPQTSPRFLWTGRENNRENGRLGERGLGFIKGE